MRLRFLAILAWVAAGHAGVGALYWALLQVPESNVFMLGLSALIIAGGVALTGVVEIAGLLGWAGRFRDAIAPSARKAAWLIPALLVVLVIWWSGTSLHEWYGRHATELDAWLMLKFRWTKTAWLHVSVGWAFWFLSYVVGLSVGLSLLSRVVRNGARELASARWIGQAFGWRQLLVLAVSILATMVIPWRYVYWRPDVLTATAAEPAFVAAKIGLLYLLACAGWTWVLRTIANRAEGPSPGTVS